MYSKQPEYTGECQSCFNYDATPLENEVFLMGKCIIVPAIQHFLKGTIKISEQNYLCYAPCIIGILKSAQTLSSSALTSLPNYFATRVSLRVNFYLIVRTSLVGTIIHPESCFQRKKSKKRSRKRSRNLIS